MLSQLGMLPRDGLLFLSQGIALEKPVITGGIR